MRPILAFSIAALLAACSAAQSGPTALFTVHGAAADQQLADTPWPNDLFLDGNGHVAIGKFPADTTALTPLALQDLNQEEDGFSVSTGAYFPVSTTLDDTTLDGNVHLFDLDSGAELPVYTHYRQYDKPLSNIYARPARGVVLLERHKYAYVISRSVRTMHGEALGPSADLSALLNAKSAPSGALARAYAIYQPLVAKLGTGTLPRAADVAGAAVFTTHSITARLTFVNTALEASPPPKATVLMCFAKTKLPSGGCDDTLDNLLGVPAMPLPGVDNPGTVGNTVGITHDHIAFIVQGTFPSPDYLNATSTISGAYGSVTQISTFDDPNFQPTPKGTATVPFTLVVPDGVDLAKPLKVAIFQHGISAQRSSMMGLANSIATQGIALLGMDIPFHGGRASGATDVKHSFGPNTGPDGWADGTSNAVVEFLDANGGPGKNPPAFLPAAIRAAFMQAAIDVMQETRLVTVGDLSALGQKDSRLAGLSFVNAPLVYTAESLGTLYGTPALAVDPRFGAAVLDVAGGGQIFDLLLNSAVYGRLIGPQLDGNLGTDTTGPYDPADTDFMYNLGQMLLEAGDSLAYSPYVILHPLVGNLPKHVLQTSAHLDEFVPNQANEALASGLGLQPVNLPGFPAADLQYWTNPPKAVMAPMTANVTVGSKTVTAAFIQFDPATHVMLQLQHFDRQYDVTQTPAKRLQNPVPVDNPIVPLQKIISSFVAGYYGGMPTVTTGQ